MAALAQSSSPAIIGSSAYEWNEEFLEGQPQTYESQNTPYVEPKSDTGNAPGSTTETNRGPRTADELIDHFLTVLGDHHMPNGPSTYQDLDLRVLCAGCHMRTVEEGLEESVQKPIALLDDRCRLANYQLTLEGHKRTNPGLLNATQLLVELKKKRHECQGEPNAYRRLVYITNPDCWAIMVLASTASSVQALYLTEFFYKYLGSKTFLGIHRPPRGVLSFALEFHLQFYVWREEDTLRQDSRKKRNNKPLRRSFQLHYLDAERQEGSSPVCIYEAQISCLVAGLDNQFWNGYLFIDTYYQEDSSPESVEWYNSQEAIKTDPLAAGTIDSNLPTWTPREYFLIVLEIVAETRALYSMTLVPSPAEDRCSSPTQKKRIQQMLNEAGRVLRQTIHSICKSIEGWDRFRNRDAQYLSDILRPKGTKTEPVPPFRVVAMIEEHVDGLRDLQHRAEQQQELCAGLAREYAAWGFTGQLLYSNLIFPLLALAYWCRNNGWCLLQPKVIPTDSFAETRYFAPGSALLIANAGMRTQKTFVPAYMWLKNLRSLFSDVNEDVFGWVICAQLIPPQKHSGLVTASVLQDVPTP
ncbi:hypothetical protein FDECE_9342 [Fusarium decemcellulare]|nr:hypothetical protein FDECE_9342 [Fusarium decemcellulare]